LVGSYYTLAALAHEWNIQLGGARFADAYSHRPNELSLDFTADDGDAFGIRFSSKSGFVFAFGQPNPRRPKSNVKSLFRMALDRVVETVEIAEGDRIIRILLTDGSRFELHAYGSRANVLLVDTSDEGSIIAEAFKRSEELAGVAPPAARAPRAPNDIEEFRHEYGKQSGPAAKIVRSLFPRLGPVLVREALERSRIDETAEELSDNDLDTLWASIEEIVHETRSGGAILYVLDDESWLLSPVELAHLKREPERLFDAVDDGVGWTVKNRGRARRLDQGSKPLAAALERAVSRQQRRVDDLTKALDSESRADQYETWGHLLMAHPNTAEPGSTEVELPDILGDGSLVTIKLDERRTTVENAERYYKRARNIREERKHLDKRHAIAITDLSAIEALLAKVRELDDHRDLERFRKQNEKALQRFVGGRSESVDSAPFRRFPIQGGYEVWVGRSAKENDLLTFKHAARHDLWLHARGVPGSHAVLKVPGRKQVVDKKTRETAAAIAAWFSNARGSALVPVQITQKKFVTKPKGALAGVVRVQNEEVILVEPRLPR